MTDQFADLDHGRHQRTGHPEVVLGEGKTIEQLRSIVKEMVSAGTVPVLITRVDAEQAAAFPDADHKVAGRAVVVRVAPRTNRGQRVAVITGGTSDLAVAEEALCVLEAFGETPMLIADAGVAGLHRTVAAARELSGVDVAIVVAGMEASLPTVLAGLTDIPLIAVPTSVGYGSSFDGLAALLSMLNSCAPGIAVVNIDNGFGAALFALRILTRTEA